MKVAIIHDWLTGMRGGEKCLEAFCELFPGADIFTLVYKHGSLSKTIENLKIKTSFLQNFPDVENKYRYYLPFMPAAIKSFDLSGYDLIISSSHCVAKGVSVPKNSMHICYCHTPMRYVWDMYGQYFDNAKITTKTAMKILRPYLQKWDIKTSKNVNYFISNSEFVSERIKKYYNREAIVINPPVDTEFFMPSTLNFQPSTLNYYLVVSAFAPYKKVDLAVKAFNVLGWKLKIIGSGQDEKKLKGIALKNIEFLGWLDNEKLRDYYRHCKALVFPGEEDFGIVPVEAQACGAPVIAYGKGGVKETVIHGKTGIFFDEQSVASLISALRVFETKKFDKNEIRKNAERFSKDRFKADIKNFIEKKVKIGKIKRL
ncbi:MAG: D-inositol 3-phosphate glycosyltransferase [Elusimicrobia bacterium ADurb.Bin231]|nr:MAG: D-inositol 3-phosphate glycosyltransferase [Elusimicrobia bacterium ADurb.Bin231]